MKKVIVANILIKQEMKMKQIVILALALFGLGVKAQTLIDPNLQQYSRQVLVDGIKDFGDDVNHAGIVIMEVTSGNVIADVCIGQFRGKVKDIDANSEPIPSGISRAVLYLSMMGHLSPDYLVETGDGLYKDSITGCVIEDLSHKRGGFGTLTLKRALDLSDVGIYKATETAFKRNMGQYGAAMRKTGIFFENCDEESDLYEEMDSWGFWSPCDIIGYRSPFSLYQQTAFVNMVANQGKLMMRFNENDSKIPIYEVKNKVGLDSLASAMFETVEYGTGLKMKSSYIRVAGLVNVSPPDVINCRGCFAAAFFPYQAPQYTIGVFVNKHDKPAGRNSASKIAGSIIEYMIKQYLHLRHIDEAFLIEKNSHKFHPAEKGR